MSTAINEGQRRPYVSITPLLKRLWPSPGDAKVTADEIAAAISLIFTDDLDAVQTGALLTALHFTAWDRRADVISKCASVMRQYALPVDMPALKDVLRARGVRIGAYHGGLVCYAVSVPMFSPLFRDLSLILNRLADLANSLSQCDIVGTGGDDHSTFNVSTAASILVSPYLLMAKHGNRASTSMSGSADVLMTMRPTAPDLTRIIPDTIPSVYEKTNYAFLFAPQFHPGMKYVAAVRRKLGWRTIFNLLGPLANPADAALEARIVGVARKDLGPVFAEALRMGGVRKAMVVCGAEDLDEISCAGPTLCWRLEEMRSEACSSSSSPDDRGANGGGDGSDGESPPSTAIGIQHFTLQPSDFGLPAHPLSSVAPRGLPHENAELLRKLLANELERDHPVLHFVLMNAAALLVIAGVCQDDDGRQAIIEEGPGGGRWKEGVRRVRQGIENGRALQSWNDFVRFTNGN